MEWLIEHIPGILVAMVFILGILTGFGMGYSAAECDLKQPKEKS